MLIRFLLLIALVCGFAVGQVASAQEGTPGAGNVAGCLVEPRSEAEMAEIRATPAVEIVPVTVEATYPIDDETRAAIEAVILMADACAEAGDYDRLAALYSPWAIQNGVLDGEPVQIESGTPGATPADEQPEPGKLGPAVVRAGWWIDETHVVAEVERGNSIRQVRLVTIDDTWLIDSVETASEVMVDDGQATPDMSTNLPIEVIQAVADLLVADGDGDASTAAFTIVSAEAVEWPDTFLGCPVEDAFAAQVITPGYLVVVEFEGEQIEVHTDLTGHAVTCVT